MEDEIWWIFKKQKQNKTLFSILFVISTKMRKTDLPLYVEDPNCHMFKKQKSELRTNAIK